MVDHKPPSSSDELTRQALDLAEHRLRSATATPAEVTRFLKLFRHEEE